MLSFLDRMMIMKYEEPRCMDKTKIQFFIRKRCATLSRFRQNSKKMVLPYSLSTPFSNSYMNDKFISR